MFSNIWKEPKSLWKIEIYEIFRYIGFCSKPTECPGDGGWPHKPGRCTNLEDAQTTGNYEISDTSIIFVQKLGQKLLAKVEQVDNYNGFKTVQKRWSVKNNLKFHKKPEIFLGQKFQNFCIFSIKVWYKMNPIFYVSCNFKLHHLVKDLTNLSVYHTVGTACKLKTRVLAGKLCRYLHGRVCVVF